MGHAIRFCGSITRLPWWGVVLMWFGVQPCSHAMAVFSRIYHQPCQQCHTDVPRLNAAGQVFLEQGYQRPEDFEDDNGVVGLEQLKNMLSFRFKAQASQSRYELPPATPAAFQSAIPQRFDIDIGGSLLKDISLGLRTTYGKDSEERFKIDRVVLSFLNLGPIANAVNFRVGRFDPSFLYVYPTQRSLWENLTVEADRRLVVPRVQRIGIAPLAFTHKFYGLSLGRPRYNTHEYALTLTDLSLYHVPAQVGGAVYGRPWPGQGGFLYEAGFVQNAKANALSTRLDFYAMVRYDFSSQTGTNFELAAYQYVAKDAAIATLNLGTDIVYDALGPTDIISSGVALHTVWEPYELFVAYTLDHMEEPRFNNSSAATSTWESRASGLSVEINRRILPQLLATLRYDTLSPGGLKYLPMSEDADQFQINIWNGWLAVAARYYLKPNISFYAAWHLNRTPIESRLPASFGGGIHWSSNTRDVFVFNTEISF